MTTKEEWLSLAERIDKAGQEIFDGADLPETSDEMNDPKVIALALLARTMGNHRGALIMLEQGQVVEARVLARCCYENLFWIASLAAKGEEFVKEMVSDHALTSRKRANRLREWAGKNPDWQNFDDQLEKFVVGLDEKHPTKTQIKQANAAVAGGIKGGYIIYGELSTDAAHPSVNSLHRHVVDRENTRTLRAIPDMTDMEVRQTIEFACGALFTVCTAANEILGSTVPLRALYDEYQALSIANSEAPN